MGALSVAGATSVKVFEYAILMFYVDQKTLTGGTIGSLAGQVWKAPQGGMKPRSCVAKIIDTKKESEHSETDLLVESTCVNHTRCL